MSRANGVDGLMVRLLAEPEWDAAFPVMQVLRPHLEAATFGQRLHEQVARGYRLAGAFAHDRTLCDGKLRDGKLCGLIGMREVLALSRGPYLHIDDLIVAPELHRRGVGEALMRYAEAEARRAGLRALYLDARPTAIPFYEKIGMRLHPSPSMYVDLV